MRELTIAATVENIEVVTDFVNEQLEALDCPIKAQMQIDIAIDELFGNIAQRRTPESARRSSIRRTPRRGWARPECR